MDKLDLRGPLRRDAGVPAQSAAPSFPKGSATLDQEDGHLLGKEPVIRQVAKDGSVEFVRSDGSCAGCYHSRHGFLGKSKRAETFTENITVPAHKCVEHPRVNIVLPAGERCHRIGQSTRKAKRTIENTDPLLQQGLSSHPLHILPCSQLRQGMAEGSIHRQLPSEL